MTSTQLRVTIRKAMNPLTLEGAMRYRETQLVRVSMGLLLNGEHLKYIDEVIDEREAAAA